jgi:hypothetical protein
MYLGTGTKTVERAFTNKTRDADKSVIFGAFNGFLNIKVTNTN